MPLPASIPVSQVAWQAVGVDFTAYSVRLAVEAPVWPDLLASLSLPVRACYITVGYALERVSVPAEEDLAAIVLQHRLRGVVSRVERHMNDPGGVPFRVRALETAELSG